MRFLNDKFFRVAVIVLLLLLALPFMFSTPEPDKGDINKPTNSFILNSLYKAYNRVATFYGFKDNKEEAEKEKTSNLSNLKKRVQLVQSKAKGVSIDQKQEEQENASAQNEQTKENNLNISETKNADNNSQNYITNNADSSFSEYATYNNNVYPVLTDKKGNKYIQTETGPVALTALPKTSKIFYRQNNEQETNQNTPTNTAIKQTNAQEQNFKENPRYKETNQYQEEYAYSNTKHSAAKNFLGQKSFSSANNKAQNSDLYQNFNENLKNVENLKLTAGEKTSSKSSEKTYIRNYKAEVYNPATQKTEVITASEKVTPESLQSAQIVKQITLTNIQGKEYNEQTFQDAKDNETSFPSQEILKQIKDEDLSPHEIIKSLAEGVAEISYPEEIDAYYAEAYTYANAQLSQNFKEYPRLEFVSGSKGQEVLSASNDSFNVMAIYNTLAKRVQLPKDNVINFNNPQNCIFVVPTENIFKEYQKLNIPVILYPDLSPLQLQRVYQTIPDAIKTYNRNQKIQKQQEQAQNEAEIEEMLRN